MLKILLAILINSTLLFSDISYELQSLKGWTIIDSKIIEGYRDNKGKFHNSFEGCDYNIKIVFTDNTYLECNSYSYSYSYRPTAIIFAKSVTYKGRNVTMFKMLVGDHIYDMVSIFK